MRPMDADTDPRLHEGPMAAAEQQFKELYREHRGRTAGIIAKLVDGRADREEAAQTLWLSVWIHLSHGNSIERPMQFLSACARNAAVKQLEATTTRKDNEISLTCLRLRMTRGVAEDDLIVEPLPPGPVDRDFARDMVIRELVRRHVERLPPRTREVIELFYYGNLPIISVARQLGISTGTAKWHLNSGRNSLAEMLMPRKKAA